MPYPSIPPELLGDIFSNLSSSSSDLYRVLLACHAFSEIVKPILYHAITIKTKLQRTRLLSITEEDKQRVRKVVILGCGMIKTKRICDYFEGKCRLGDGCVSDLLLGKLLDISVIEVLHVRHVHESQVSAHDSVYHDLKLRAKTASRLVEISIWNHQGGGPIWKIYLKNETVPTLRRLAYDEVTDIRMEPLDETDPDHRSLLNSGEEHKLVDRRTTLGYDVPYSRLEVLVAVCNPKLAQFPDFPLNNFLALMNNETWFGTETTLPFKFYIVCRFSLWHTSNMSNVLSALERTASLQRCDLECLFLTERAFPWQDSQYEQTISILRSKGVEVVEDSEWYNVVEEISLIPDSFVKYITERGKITDEAAD